MKPLNYKDFLAEVNKLAQAIETRNGFEATYRRYYAEVRDETGELPRIIDDEDSYNLFTGRVMHIEETRRLYREAKANLDETEEYIREIKPGVGDMLKERGMIGVEIAVLDGKDTLRLVQNSAGRYEYTLSQRLPVKKNDE